MSSDMSDQQMQLLIDLHKNNERQGPGGREETELAMYLAGVDFHAPMTVADIGCGTGASSLTLADHLNAHITCVDFLQDFLDELQQRAHAAEVSEKITTLCCSMDALPFEPASLDMIWSEGAIYNIGFEAGIRNWRGFLKESGLLVASEITWTRDERPAELQQYWEQAYPEIDTASVKIAQLEKNGYQVLGYFILPKECWLENYYHPIANNADVFIEEHDGSESAHQIIASEREEIALYEKYSDYYSYGVYIARKTGK